MCCHESDLQLVVQYDIDQGDARRRKRLNRYIFDWEDSKRRRDGTLVVTRHRGAIHEPGVRWLGLSVIPMSPGPAEEFVRRLRAWGVRHTTTQVHLA